MSPDHQATFDVVVAGAGPVGLFLACELALAGCTVLVLERATSPDSPLKHLPFGLRGLTLPTMDSLDRRDLLDPIRARMTMGNTVAAAPWTTGSRRPAGHFAGLQFFRDMVDEEAWPWRLGGSSEMLAVAMADIEHVLAIRAAELGVTIRHGCGVDSLEDVPDGLLVHAAGEAIRTGWLVGCDGGRSTVRKIAGIEFAGTEPEFTGYSMAVRVGDPHALRPGRQHGASGMYTYAPPGMVTMVDFDGGASHRATPLTRAHVEAVLRRVSNTGVDLLGVDLATTWTDRAFLAARYRRGRVLLAGDAAHVHAPLGGQGLNLGLGDAMNLGWKLGAIVAGRASLSLLDSYEQERRPIARQVLDWSRAQVAMLRPGPGTAAMRAILRDVMETRDGATYFAGRVWGAEQRYDAVTSDHPLVGRSAPDVALGGGRRLHEVLRDGRAWLLDLDPAEPLRASAATSPDAIGYLASTTAQAIGADALLVRPDGVVAWAGSGHAQAEVARFMARLFDPDAPMAIAQHRIQDRASDVSDQPKPAAPLRTGD